MKLLFVLALAGLVTVSVVQAQQKEVPVFVSGTDGYKTFRIPAIIKAPDGGLLAFCEGRRNGMSDFGKYPDRT
jgi:sialidase-1